MFCQYGLELWVILDIKCTKTEEISFLLDLLIEVEFVEKLGLRYGLLVLLLLCGLSRV